MVGEKTEIKNVLLSQHIECKIHMKNDREDGHILVKTGELREKVISGILDQHPSTQNIKKWVFPMFNFLAPFEPQSGPWPAIRRNSGA